MKIFPLILLAAVAGFFGWFVVVFSLSNLLKQHEAESFPHVQGEVLSSQVTTTRGSKGHINYHPSIRYRYNVDGQEYTGWRYRYDGHPTDSDSANEIVSAHPAGSAIDVYYRPGYPEDCLLCPGVDQPDAGMFFFFAAIIMFFLWLIIAKGGKEIIWPWEGALVAGGVNIITEMMVVRVRLPRFQPLSMGLITSRYSVHRGRRTFALCLSCDITMDGLAMLYRRYFIGRRGGLWVAVSKHPFGQAGPGDR